MAWKLTQAAVRCIAPPTDKEGVHRFLGFATYLLKFIPNLSKVDAPLPQLTKNNVDFSWDPTQLQAFNKLKHLCTHTLQFYDVTQPVEIYCDAARWSTCCLLLQITDWLRDTLCQIEKELHSIVHACIKFHHYIFGKHVTIYNDHKPLEEIF